MTWVQREGVDGMRDDDPPCFMACAMLAYIEVAREQGRYPDSEAVKRLAYQIYERELKAYNAE